MDTLHIIFNLQREDNLSIKDKMGGSSVSAIQRFHCRPMESQLEPRKLPYARAHTTAQ